MNAHLHVFIVILEGGSLLCWVAGGAGLCVESQVEQVRTECVVVKYVLGRSQSRSKQRMWNVFGMDSVCWVASRAGVSNGFRMEYHCTLGTLGRRQSRSKQCMWNGLAPSCALGRRQSRSKKSVSGRRRSKSNSCL
jgi:hypothetical protein